MASSSRVGVITEEERQQLLERYLDIVWIDDVTEVKCVRCGRVPIHHYVSNCQHIYCRNCRTVFSDGGQWRCPSCRQYVTELSDQDFKLEDTIYQLTAHCPNKKYGCPYQGQLKTMPGHLKHCKNTREAALPAEFKGITLDTAVNKIMTLTDIIGEMRSEMNELKDKCETQWKQPETLAAELEKIKEFRDEINKQKEQLANVEEVVKDVQELKESVKQLKLNDKEFTRDIKMIKWDVYEQKGHLTKLLPLLKDVEDLKATCETKLNRSEKTLDGLETDIKAFKQELNDEKERYASMKQILNGIKERESRDALDMQKFKSQLEQQHTLVEVLTQHLNEQKQQSANVEQILKEKELRDALEMQQLRTQLQQQQTLIDTHSAQAEQIARLNVTLGYMQSASTDLKENWDTKWKDINKHMDKVNKDQREQKQQMVEITDKQSKNAMELQQMMSQLEQQQTLINTNTARANTNSENLKNIDIRIEKLQSEAKDWKYKWDSNWSDVNKQLDNCQRDQHEHKQQLENVKDKGDNIKVKVEELRCKVEQQETFINTNITQLGSVETQLRVVMNDLDEAEKGTQAMIKGYEVMPNGLDVMKITRIPMPHQALQYMTLVYQWDITDIRWDENRESEVFPLTGYDFGAKVTIRLSGYSHIYVQWMDYNITNRPVYTKSVPKFTFVFVSQSHDTQVANTTQHISTTTPHKDGIRTKVFGFNDSLVYGKDIDGRSSWGIYKFFGPPYVLSNGMKLSVYIERPSMARSFFANNGILLWRLDNYKERKQMEVDDLIEWHESPYFYTSPHGYRVLLRLRLSGEKVWGQLWFVKGEHDSSLTRPFPHRLTVTLFNHTYQSKNLVVIKEGAEAESTYFEFDTALESMFLSKGYIKDDSLLIKAVVEPL